MRFIEFEGQKVLDTQLVGLIPFAPLMKPPEGMVAVQWLRRCVQTADGPPLDHPSKANFLTDPAILSGLVYESQTIINIISEETMYESSIVQYFTERAILQGERKSTIEDLQSLKQLHRSAVQVSNLDEFRQTLDSMTNEK